MSFIRENIFLKSWHESEFRYGSFMRITAKIKTRASKNEVVKMTGNSYKISVTAIPEKGKANDKIIEILAKYFKISKNRISIISGLTHPNKVINIDKD